MGQTLINHPPNHNFYRWYINHIPKWVVYGIVLPTLHAQSSALLRLPWSQKNPQVAQLEEALRENPGVPLALPEEQGSRVESSHGSCFAMFCPLSPQKIPIQVIYIYPIYLWGSSLTPQTPTIFSSRFSNQAMEKGDPFHPGPVLLMVHQLVG